MGVKGVDDMSVEEFRAAAIEAVKKPSADVGIAVKPEALKEEELLSWCKATWYQSNSIKELKSPFCYGMLIL